MSIFISIIIPIYNVERYIIECIDSIISQGFDNLQLILIDDGSTDRSGEICDKYSALYPTIETIHTPNKGVSAARNKGLDLALGEWIWFVDGDDMIQKGALAMLYENITPRWELVQFALSKLRNGTIEMGKTQYIEGLTKNQFLTLYPSYHNHRMLFRRRIIERYGLRFSEGLRRAEDLEFQIKYLLHAEHLAELPYDLYIYRIREDSAMHSPRSNIYIVEDSMRVLHNWLEYFRHHNIAIEGWLDRRLTRFIKTLLLAAIRGGVDNPRTIQTPLRQVIKSYRQYSPNTLRSPSIQLARWSIEAYFIIEKLHLKYQKL